MTKTFAVASADGTATRDVTVTITGANDSPTVSGAVSLGHTAEDNSVTFTKAQLLANAHDTDTHDTLSVTNLSAANGTIVDNGNGTYTFTPTENFSGHVNLSYTVSDGHGGTAAGSASLDVDAVADAPVISLQLGTGAVSSLPGASENVTIDVNNMNATGGGFSVSALGLNGSAGTLSTHTNPAGFGVAGAASGDQAELGQSGGRSEAIVVNFDNDVSSANVSFAWLASNEKAHYDLFRDGVKVGEGTVSGVTDAVDPAIRLATSDGGAFDRIVFSAPSGGDNDYLINSISFVKSEPGEQVVDYPLNVSASLKDTDGSESLSVTLTGLPEGATVVDAAGHAIGTDNGNGTWSLPRGDLAHLSLRVPADAESFTLGATATATEADANALVRTASTSVSVEVHELNHGPEFSAPTGGSGTEDHAVTGRVMATDVDGDTLTYSFGAHADGSPITSVATAHGTVTINPATGEYSFSPTSNWAGGDSFDVTVSDGRGGVATHSVDVQVAAVADQAMVSVSIGAGVEAPNGSFTVTNLDTTASAGYHNTYGYYVMDANGNPTSGGVIWSDVHASPNASATISGVDPDRVGFFLIPDGGSQNSGLANGAALTFSKDASGNWQATDSAGHVLSGAGTKVLFDKASLNSDRLVHSEDSSTVSGNQNWEDLAGGGDRDYNDVNMSVTWNAAAPTATHPLTVSASFPDMDGSETHTVKISGLPSGSTLYQNGVALVAGADGSYALNPSQLAGLSVKTPAGFSGDLNVTVTATSLDGTSVATSSASATVHDDLANHGPDAGAAASVTTVTNTAVNGQVVATDADGDSLHFTLSTGSDGPQHGSVVLNPDGTFTYTPAGSYNGTDSFKVQISDGHGGTTTETVSVTVGRPNHGPVAGDDSRIDDVAQGPALAVSMGTTTVTTTTTGGTAAAWAGLADMGDPTTAATTTNISGSLNSALNGTTGADAIKIGYDTNSAVSVGAGNDQVTIGRDANAKVDLGSGDNALHLGGDANAGIVAGSGNDSIRIDGALNSGKDRDSNILSGINLGDGDNRLQVGGNVNSTIIAGSGADDVKIGGDLNANISLGAGNDDLHIGGSVYAAVNTGDGNDRVLVGGNASSQITLGSGDDSLEIKGNVWSSIDAGSGNDTVRIGGDITANVSLGDGNDRLTISGRNLWATVSGGTGTDSIELTGVTKAQWDANTDSVRNYVRDFENIKFSDGQVIGDASAFQTATTTSTYKTPLTIQATLNDRDGSETLSPVTIGNIPAGGRLELNGQALTPNADGSYTLNVTSGSPVTVTLVTSSPVSAGSLNLTTSVASTESHGGDVSVTTLVGVGSNAGETTVDDRIATGSDHKVVINASDLLANDTDADGDTLSIVSVGNAQHGTVSIDNAGHITFTAEAGYNGTTTFDYTVSDGHGGTDVGTVSVYVVDPNHAPVIDAAHTTATLNVDYSHANASNIGQVAATDADGDKLTYSVLDGGTHHGSLHVDSATGAMFYDAADSHWSGSDTFSIQVSDGHGGLATQTVSVNVTGGDYGAPPDAGHAVGWGNGGGRSESWGENGSWSVDGGSGHANNGWGNGDQSAPGNSGSNNNAENAVTHASDDGTNWTSNYSALDVGNGGHSGTGDMINLAGYNRHNEYYVGDAGETLIGAGGNDYMSLQGVDGNQHISGYDHIQLGDGANVILDMTTTRYDYGNLTVAGGTGHDVIWSAGGDDLLVAGNGGNTIHGGAGNDTIVAGAGSDNLMGQDGNDTFLFDFGTGHDTVNGGAGGNWTDTIDLSTNMHAGATIEISSGGHDWTVTSDGDHHAAGAISLGQDKSGTITVHSSQGDQTIEFTNIENIKF
jgi:VCBS repeat-containing protein